MKTNSLKIFIASIALFIFFGIGNAFAECEDTSLTVTGTFENIGDGIYIKGVDYLGYGAWYNDDGWSIKVFYEDEYFYILDDINLYDSKMYSRLSDDPIGAYNSTGYGGITGTYVSATICPSVDVLQPLFSLSQGKATSSAIELYASVGTVSTSIFSSFSAYLYLILGILIAWFIIQTLYNFFKEYMEKDKKFEKQTKDLIEKGNRMTEKIKKINK